MTRIGNYELLRPLGAGGMAQTFVAIRRGVAGFEQKVCLKRILPQYADDPALVEQFLDEARLLAHLRHANVVQVYDFGEADGSYYMALELIDGADLDNVLRFLVSRQCLLPVQIALHVMSETLKALHYAHNAELDGESLQLVHRDVSPSNILLSRAGEVKLVDFGIAKSRHRRHQTRAGHTKGKVAYMSPEQVRGEPLDGRSDLFSVGIVLHELLTGVHPFDARTDVAVLSNVLRNVRPSLAALAPTLPPELVQLVDTLLATDPANRPQSAASALAFMPSLENEFLVERKLEELVAAYLRDKDARVELRSRVSEAPAPGPTAALTANGPAASLDDVDLGQGLRHSAGSASRSTAEMPRATVETLESDALRKVEPARPFRKRALLVATALAVTALLGWFALRKREDPAAVGVTPAAAELGSVPKTPIAPDSGGSVLPAAPKPTDSSLRLSETAPAAGTDGGRTRVSSDAQSGDEPARAQRVRVERHETSPSRDKRARSQRPSRTGTRQVLAPDGAEPPATTPAPSKSSSRHRTNVEISNDDF